MKIRVMLAVVVLLVIAVELLGVRRDNRIRDGFRAIQPHATEAEVRAALGAPSQVDSSCQAYGTQMPRNCDHVLVYRASFAAITHNYWLVFIDPTGHTSATSRQSQP